MKKFIKIGLFVFFFHLFLTPSLQAKAYDFTVDAYQVDIKVTKQNTYRITERITANFYYRRHGINRDIPLLNIIKRKDGSTDRVMAKVENISCSEKYETSRVDVGEVDYCRLRIGDEDRTVIGEKVYTISYDYIMGNDVLAGNDEFYFNVIGNGWTSPIRNVSFKIEMPDAFEEKNLGMSYGYYGDELLEGLTWQLEGNTIYGELAPGITLLPNQGVNVRLLLKEGYFERIEEHPWVAFVSIAVAIMGALIAFILWYIFGRDDPVIETVEFYPPNGLNSLELAFAYKGSVDNEDVVSLLIYLAQKGYLTIREEGKKNFVIEKVKEYDGFNDAEKIFFDGLFSHRSVVRKSDLTNSFYQTINMVKAVVDNKKNKKIIYHASSINKGWLLWLLTILSFVFALAVPVCEYYYSLLFGLGAGVGVAIYACIVYTMLFSPGGKIIAKIIGFVFLAVVGGVLYLVFLANIMRYANTWYKTALFLDLLFAAVTMFFCVYMSKRTPYGTEILGKIRGFRAFLETSEKERLEALVNDDPQYFYEILPYTYVLDISDKWIKKFESIAVMPPQWYAGGNYSMFDMMVFHHFMNDTMTQATRSMTSTPSQSSSGGGGFSGGGAGGGGGSSW